MTVDELRRSNAGVRDKIRDILERHPELRDVDEDLALYRDLHVEVGTPFLERVQGKLQERARASLERRSDLQYLLDDGASAVPFRR
jgi:hypothetical protein